MSKQLLQFSIIKNAYNCSFKKIVPLESFKQSSENEKLNDNIEKTMLFSELFSSLL